MANSSLRIDKPFNAEIGRKIIIVDKALNMQPGAASINWLTGE
jgi:hypothetical protein